VKKLIPSIVAMLFTVSALIVSGSALSASMVQKSCTHSLGAGTFCIRVTYGEKDYTHHTEYVAAIRMTSTFCQHQFEAWTQNYYASSSSGCSTDSGTWVINKWVQSGNYVCGRGTRSGKQTTACQAIKV
jgi:hypothetical protein